MGCFNWLWGAVVYLFVGLCIAVVVEVLSYALVDQSSSREKLSSYECGFDAFSDMRGGIDVKFYLLGVLFLVFDIEGCMLFPYATAAFELGWVGYCFVVDFIVELVLCYMFVVKYGGVNAVM